MAHVSSTTKTENAATATSVLTLTAAVPAGHTLLGAICWESSAGTTPTISSIVDSRGNTWTTTPDVAIDAGTTLAVAIIRAGVTTALHVGDTITVTITATRTRWAWQIDEFDDLNTSPKDAAVSNAPGSSASLSTGTTGTTTQAYELLYAVYGFGSGRTVTIPSGWSGGSQVVSSAGSSDRAVQAAWKYTATTGAQQGTLTLSSASTYAGALVTYKATSLVPPVGHVSQVKLQVPQPTTPAVGRVSQVRFQAPAGAMGVLRISQVKLRAPTVQGQSPYSGIKYAHNGTLVDSSLLSARNGQI